MKISVVIKRNCSNDFTVLYSRVKISVLIKNNFSNDLTVFHSRVNISVVIKNNCSMMLLYFTAECSYEEGSCIASMLYNLYGEYLMKEALPEVGYFNTGGRIINRRSRKLGKN